MMRMFVSSQAVDRTPASLLIARGRALGWTISHSPSNPLDADDPRWAGWYDRGLAEALADTEAFVAVIDEVWDSSTWMAIEAEEARRMGQPSLRCYSWNPNAVPVKALGMKKYVEVPLPQDLDAAVAVLEADRTSRCS